MTLTQLDALVYTNAPLRMGTSSAPTADFSKDDRISSLGNDYARALVLSNPDLLEICFSFFDPDAFFKDIWEIGTCTRNKLLNAALTCKAFFEPAMSLLWRMMESIIPVLKVLPTFVKTSNDTFTINGPITGAEMQRLRLYSKNVRYLYLCGSQESIAGHALLRLSHINGPLFPGLTTVFVSIPTLILRNVENLNCLFLTGNSPSLTTISFTDVTYSTEDFIASFLSFASHGPSAIEKITLRGRLTSNSLSLLGEFGKLKSLSLSLQSTTIQSQTLLECGKLAYLEDLSIRLDNSSTFDDRVTAGLERPMGFPSLKTMELSGPTAEIVRILASFTTPTLQTITISFSPSWAWASPDAVADCIRECGTISPSSLRHLRLLGGTANGINLPRGCLLPLAECSQLRSLELSGAGLSLTDADVQQICESGGWRNLEAARLPSSPERDSPSLLSVYTLAKHCTRLQHLTMSINFGLLDQGVLQAERAAPRTDNLLQYLSILKVVTNRELPASGSTLLGISVSRFLEHHFRQLKTIQYTTDSMLEVEWWTGVKAMIKEYQDIRDEMRLIHDSPSYM